MTSSLAPLAYGFAVAGVAALVLLAVFAVARWAARRRNP